MITYLLSMRAEEMKLCDIFTQAGGLAPQPITCIAQAGGAFVPRNEYIFISARGLAADLYYPRGHVPLGKSFEKNKSELICSYQLNI